MLVNAQAERLFGYRRADLEEQPVESWCRTRSGPGTVPCGRGMRLTRDDLQRTNRNLESLAYSIAHDLAWKFTAGRDDAVIEFGMTPVADAACPATSATTAPGPILRRGQPAAA